MGPPGTLGDKIRNRGGSIGNAAWHAGESHGTDIWKMLRQHPSVPHVTG